MIPIQTARDGLHCVAWYRKDDNIYIELAWTETGAVNKMFKTLEKMGVI